MTQINPDDSKVPSYSPADPMDTETHSRTSPKVDCSTHGPSQVPLIDNELQKPHAKEIIRLLTAALNDLTNEKKCTRCTVESISTQLTGHVRDLRAAKRSGAWSKEEKKAYKAEVKGLFKPIKKDLKKLWKGN